MPVIRIEIPPELLLHPQEEVIIRLDTTHFGMATTEDGCQGTSFLSFMDEMIALLCSEGRLRTKETYVSTKNSFSTFLGGKGVTVEQIDSQLMVNYEAWLKRRGVKPNSVSFYMRILRAVYNKAIDRMNLPDNKPFRHVYTGVEKTRKRAISGDILQELQRLYASVSEEKRFAIDMFFFSFYARGMSFVDMAHLKKTDIVANVIVYKRKKTGQRLQVKCEDCLLEIMGRHRTDTPYALPIITNDVENTDTQYRRCLRRVNRHLKQMGKKLGLEFPLTTYVARHSWATIARNLDIPLNVISESMGHTNEQTTRIYLDSIASDVIDRANQSIIEAIALPHDPQE